MKSALLVLLLALSAADAKPAAKRLPAARSLAGSHGTGASLSMEMYKADCGRKRHVSLAMAQRTTSIKRAAIPGAGMVPAAIEPYMTVLKDGFFEVACVKDSLFEFGDAHGNNKASYKMSTNVSIIHYTEMVPKEDQSPMTREVCFDFCRTVPDMTFFGINNGRDCYCAPYFVALAGDSSACDAVCEGNPTTMCGGKLKSSIFEMHMCANTATDLADTVAKATELAKEIGSTTSLEFSAKMQTAAEEYQNMFGKAGDPTASDLMQTAKVSAGELQHAAEAALGASKALSGLTDSAAALDGADFKDNTKVKEAEKLIDDLEHGVAAAEAAKEAWDELHSAAAGAAAEEGAEAEKKSKEAEGPSVQYYPIMYFVDKAHKLDPSTCGGTPIGSPMAVKSKDECAAACDADVHSCVGYSFYGDLLSGDPSLCFLMSKFKSVTYYTGCNEEEELIQAASFLQLAKARQPAGAAIGCYAKLSEFEGATLKPDPSGKCDLCLKSATKAARCYD